MKRILKSSTRILCFVSCTCIFSFAQAQIFPGDIEVLPDHKVLVAFAKEANTQPLPLQFSLLSWNSQKGEKGDAYFSDLGRLAQNHALILLQEAMNDSRMPRELVNLRFQDSANLFWNFTDIWMAQSFLFRKDNTATGVATLALSPSEQVTFHRSPSAEPILQSPKMTLGTVYRLAHEQRLLVLNIHALNFTANSAFEQQINALVAVIAQFKGKVVFAGDFNTRNSARHAFLDRKMQELGMSQVELEGGATHTSGMILDHIFVRGCKILSAQLHKEVKSADHYPISAKLDCQ